MGSVTKLGKRTAVVNHWLVNWSWCKAWVDLEISRAVFLFRKLATSHTTGHHSAPQRTKPSRKITATAAWVAAGVMLEAIGGSGWFHWAGWREQVGLNPNVHSCLSPRLHIRAIPLLVSERIAGNWTWPTPPYIGPCVPISFGWCMLRDSNVRWGSQWVEVANGPGIKWSSRDHLLYIVRITSSRSSQFLPS